jgi:hypothetical protein
MRVRDSAEGEIRLGGFVDFVCARSTRRIAAVADVVSTYAESYAPERDFYGPMRKALLDGVVNGTTFDARMTSSGRVARGSDSTTARSPTDGNAGAKAKTSL